MYRHAARHIHTDQCTIIGRQHAHPHAPVHTQPQTHAWSPGTQGHTHSTSPHRGSQQLLSHPERWALTSRTSMASGSIENLIHCRKKESRVPRTDSRPLDTLAHLLALRQALGPAPSVQGRQCSPSLLGHSRHHAPPLLAELGPCHHPGLSLNVTRKPPLWTELPTPSDLYGASPFWCIRAPLYLHLHAY